MKILIVDDNLSMRKALSALLEANGHQVLAALESGIGLLDAVRQQAPDLVCLDYHLPGQNGLELLVDLQAAAPTVDVVIMTAATEPELVGRAANAGAVGFLRKPFSQTQILDEIRQIDNGRQLAARPDETALDLRLANPAAQRTAVIVDDSSSVRLLMKSILKDSGFTVLQTAASGEEGIAAAARHSPALICLDVEMPGLSGLDALPRIREASPASKVVMVTGNPDKSFVDAAIRAGAKGYILKPVRPSYVETFLQKLFA